MIRRAIARLMNWNARGERPDWRDRTYRVLALRYDRIGEMILSTGVLRAIAESYPTIQLDVLASPLNAPVLRNEQYVHEVVTFDPSTALRLPGALVALRRMRYDAVLDCMDAPPSVTTTLLLHASGAPYRYGVATREDAFAYTIAVPPRETQRHFVDRLAAIVAVFGLQPAGLDVAPRVHLTAAERERGERAWLGDTEHRPSALRILINVSASPYLDAWPDSRFIAVARAAREHVRAAEIVVVSARRDRTRAAVIAAESGARFVENDGIRDAMAIVGQSHVVLTPESSIGHVSTALAKPAIVLHPRGRGDARGPYGPIGRALESATSTLSDIPADAASRALMRLLSESLPHHLA
jgi:ADP-heptose:LPS heptosyltransferase